jgi:serine/threonine protein kinase
LSDPEGASAGSGAGKALPERLGKYEILERLGQGAMGVVYRGHDPLLERDVALKVMLPQVAEDPDQKFRFEREAKAVARMMHPHVVAVFDLGYHTDGSPYIVMEYLQGQDLQMALREGTPLTLEQKVAILLDVLEGLRHAHAAGIVHRDIKPANVFLTENGDVKIMDFGVAHTPKTSETQGVIVGTADYMSPEQVAGTRVDGRSDLFSVGAMLCELVTGRRPFHGESLVSILYKIAHEDPRIELPDGPEYEALAPILRKALVKGVDERYQTAHEFAEALAEYAKALPEGQAAARAAAEAEVGTQETILLSSSPTASVAEEPRPEEAGDLGPIVLSLDFTSEPYAPEPPAPPADPTPVFQLMREILAAKKSGHLRFGHGKSHRSLRFFEGQVLHAMSDVSGERLGDVLVRYGKLTQEILDRAIPIVLNKKRRLGPVLLENAFLDRATLDEGVGLHAREILFESAARGGGRVSFDEAPPGDTPSDDAASNLSTVELILEAARRVADPTVVRNVLGDLDRTLVADQEAFRRLTNIAFTPADGFLLSQIDGRTSARDVFKLIPAPTENVERSLFSLLCTGVVEYAAPAARVSSTIRMPAPARPTTVARPVPAPPRTVMVTKPPHPTATSEAGEDLKRERQRIEETRARIVTAYDALEHQDHFEFFGLERKSNDMQVREAYARMVKLFHPDALRDPALSDVQDLGSKVFLRIREAWEQIRTRDGRRRYEETLPRVAKTGTVPEPVYDAPGEPATAAAKGSWVAREQLRLAEMNIVADNPREAISLLESALPQLEGHDLVRGKVAWARATARSPKALRQAQQVLSEVVEQNPRAHEAYLALGDIYRVSHMNARAIVSYRKVLELDPANHHAKAALRDLEGPGPESGGLLKKIFKK